MNFELAELRTSPFCIRRSPGLPANLFYSTGIPVCILVLKKCKKPDDVLFINAAGHFVKGKRQNQLTEDHIARIIDTYKHRTEAPRYSRRLEMDEPERSGDRLHEVQPEGRAKRVKSRRTTST